MSIRATAEWNPFTGQMEPIRPTPVMDEIPRQWDPFTGRMEPINRSIPILNAGLSNGFALGTDPFGGGLAGRYLAQLPNKLTPVQAAAKSFGDIPILGNLIKTIRDYEDRINYRNADPETRKLLGLE